MSNNICPRCLKDDYRIETMYKLSLKDLPKETEPHISQYSHMCPICHFMGSPYSKIFALKSLLRSKENLQYDLETIEESTAELKGF